MNALMWAIILLIALIVGIAWVGYVLNRGDEPPNYKDRR